MTVKQLAMDFRFHIEEPSPGASRHPLPEEGKAESASHIFNGGAR